MVVWTNPLAHSHKVNVDGSSLGNLGHSGGGGVIRDSNGYSFFFFFLHGFSFYCGKGTKLFAEVKSLLERLKLCVRLGDDVEEENEKDEAYDFDFDLLLPPPSRPSTPIKSDLFQSSTTEHQSSTTQQGSNTSICFPFLTPSPPTPPPPPPGRTTISATTTTSNGTSIRMYEHIWVVLGWPIHFRSQANSNKPHAGS
ncbi:hypothetical protein ACH5RR_003014 [Cinchona calisaya]|uniref:Uncharacterized protein n=1 Tax=Cinchona calisaya TaxID=153742 RepID=A0ABD3ATR1_9GENT